MSTTLSDDEIKNACLLFEKIEAMCSAQGPEGCEKCVFSSDNGAACVLYGPPYDWFIWDIRKHCGMPE